MRIGTEALSQQNRHWE